MSSRTVVAAKVAVQLTTKMLLAEYDHMVEESRRMVPIVRSA